MVKVIGKMCHTSNHATPETMNFEVRRRHVDTIPAVDVKPCNPEEEEGTSSLKTGK